MYSSCVRCLAVCLSTLMLSAVPAAAQDQSTPQAELFAAAANSAAPPVPLPEQMPAASLPASPFAVPAPPHSRRPSALLPLYVSFASLQALDAHSTSRALDHGAVEANPLMRGIAGNTAGMLAVKAAGTAGVIYAGEKLWRRNKTAAVLFMVAANSALALVVQHNYRTVR